MVTDPIGDAGFEPKFDLVTGTQGVNPRGKIVHNVKLAGKAAKPIAENWAKLPRLRILVEGDGTYTVFMNPTFGEAQVWGAEYTGRASIERVKDNVLRYSFRPAAIGSPNSYGWRVDWSSDDLYYDRMPNSGYVTHALNP